jgi:hypothetical protein
MVGLITTLLIDTSIVKIYDLVSKNFMPSNQKLVLFFVNSFACLFLQYLLVYYLRKSFIRHQPLLTQSSKIRDKIFIGSILILAILLGLMTYQMFYRSSYFTLVTILAIDTTYLTASSFLIILANLFVSWYKSNRNLLILLYALSILLIAFNLIVTAVYTSLIVNDKPDEIRRFVGGSLNISVARYAPLSNLYTVSSILSFASIWITTAVLMKNYKDKFAGALTYWTVLSIPLIYFLTNYFSQAIFSGLFVDYLTVNPTTVSLALTAFLSLSKPVGGLTFGIVFWRIARRLSYDRKIRTYMVISGWGILLLFATNQAILQILTPYPPFGIATLTALILAGYLMLTGIYNSAELVSANTDLRRSIYKHTFESRLLELIGKAEMDKEIQKTVSKILKDRNIQKMNEETIVDLDQEELKKHLDMVLKEVKKEED